MADVSARPRLAGRSPGEVVIDRIWRFFCSVRAAVYEIVVLTLIVLLGTLRGSSVPQMLADNVPFTKPIVTRWYAYDFFHSLPFAFILTLLSVAITICTINRAPGIWRTIAHPTVPTSWGFLRGAETSARLAAPADGPALTDQLTSALRRQRYRVLLAQKGEETHLYADKNRYAKLGTFPFHLALILILVGGIVGARYGFRDQQFIVPEGSTRAVGHGTDLSIKLDRFIDSYYQNGVAQSYQSNLVLLKDGQPVKTGSITVNHPMTYHNVVIYQSSFGDAASFRITDSAGHVLYDDSTPLGLYHAVYNPNAPAGVITLPQGYQISVIAPDDNPGNVPTNDPIQIQSGQMYVEVHKLGDTTPSTTRFPGKIINQGTTANVNGLNVEFLRERRYTLLQVANNPGIPIFILAAFLLVGGLAVTFYFPHRRIRGIIAASDTGAVAQLVPLAKRDWSGQRDFQRLLDELERTLGLSVTRQAGRATGAARLETAEADA